MMLTEPYPKDESFDLDKDPESEQSPSGGYRFVMWQMRVEA
jgi:hypothetical protein